MATKRLFVRMLIIAVGACAATAALAAKSFSIQLRPATKSPDAVYVWRQVHIAVTGH